jgi:5-methyltetrahydrofolate--homocysteine methyltransferase
MLNSVNGKEESLERVMPLVKKYGAVVVALCLDDSGIPLDMAGRVAIAEKIIAKAAEYGIASNNIVVDPLALTISTGGDNARVACEVITAMQARDIKTVMGVSNISFGLPGRELINSTFFTLALSASCAPKAWRSSADKFSFVTGMSLRIWAKFTLVNIVKTIIH